MIRSVRHFVLLACSASLTASCMFAQSMNSNAAGPVSSPVAGVSTPSTSSAVEPQPSAPVAQDSGIAGFGVKAGLLGIGAETAVRVTHRTNLRAGFNVLGYSRTFNKDGVAYDGHLAFRTIEAHYDVFPWARSFHVSPGLLAYIGDPVKAHAALAGNQNFTLGGTTYYSDPAAPVFTSGKMDFNSVAPMVTVGWGNLVHRDSKRFSVPFEIGVAFQGSPKTTLNMTGSVCDTPTGGNCRAIASDPTVQNNIVSEQAKINNSISAFKVYPIISAGFGYKF